MGVDIIAMPTMVIEAMDAETLGVEAMTVVETGEVIPDHVVMGEAITSTATDHSAHGSPIPAISNHGQSDMPVIPGGLTMPTQNGLTTPTQTAGGCGATRAKARANVTGRP